MEIFGLHITKKYVYFKYCGDYIYYIFSWARGCYPEARFYSTDFNSYFSSLKEIKKIREDYSKG